MTLLGVLAGLAAALPPAVALHRPAPTLRIGVVAMLTSFALLAAAVVVVRAICPGALVPFAVVAALTFLATVLIVALRRGGTPS